MKIEIQTVTPEQAEAWLATNTDNNRRISKATVSRYAQDMIRGQWLITGEAIKFDTEGRHIDGQHRLSAVLASRKSVQMCVIYNLPAQTMLVIDTGKSRSAGDALQIAGHNGMSNEIGALIRKIIAYESGSTNLLGVKKIRIAGATITNRQIVEYAAANDLTPHVSFAHRMKYQAVNAALNYGEYAFFHWLFSRVDPLAADKFLSQIATMENVSANSPIRLLIQKLTRSSITLDGRMKMFAIITAWNAWRRGENITDIRVGRINQDDPIPQAV